MWRRAGLMTCVLLAAVGTACGGGGDGSAGKLYPDRANQYREDQERHIGGSVRIGGFTTTVTDVQLDGDTVRVFIRIRNRDQAPQRIDATQWTLVNPRIQTLETTSADFPLTDLPGGKTVKAEVSFTIEPEETGNYYVQYKPEILDAARGIWRWAGPGRPSAVSSSSMRSRVVAMFARVFSPRPFTIHFESADSQVMSQLSRTRVPPSTGSSS